MEGSFFVYIILNSFKVYHVLQGCDHHSFFRAFGLALTAPYYGGSSSGAGGGQGQAS